MKLISYLKENGLKHVLNVIYEYKIDILYQKIALSVTRNKPLKNTIIDMGSF